MKTLTIISEVFIKEDGTETVDRSFNIIIGEYSKYFERVNVIGPGKKGFEFIQGNNKKIFFTATTLYAKPIKHRIKYYLNIFKAKRYFKSIIKKGNTDIVQIRIPSLFSMLAFSVVQDLKIPLTTYIAGEWYSSFVANYKFIGNSFVARILDNKQKKIIKNSIPVSAGKEITYMYKELNEIYPYFSTTHKKAIRVNKNNSVLQLLYVGRFENIKRIADAINAVSILKDENINVLFNIVGDGVENDNLLNLVRKLKIEKSIVFHGHISNTEKLEEQYKDADIFVFPSVSEGTPKVLAEAMSYGAIPIAVKDTGSIRFIVEDGKNGFLVDAYSPNQIALKIQQIKESKELQNEMQEHCYIYAKEHTIIKEVESLWQYVFNRLEKEK